MELCNWLNRNLIVAVELTRRPDAQRIPDQHTTARATQIQKAAVGCLREGVNSELPGRTSTPRR
jgi:hypothetical protein